MKNFTLFTIMVLSYAAVSAQDTLPNPSFENWTNGGGYLNPDGWGTINQLVPTVFRTNVAVEVHSGTYAVKLQSAAIGPNIAPGICVTGQVNIATNGVDGGLAYNLRPVSITGWFMYHPGTGDTGIVTLTLSKWNGTSRDIIGEATQVFSDSVNTYTQFVKNIEYSSIETPDTAVIVLLSSTGTSQQASTTLFLDDLAFSNSGTGVENYSTALKVGVGPNPAQNTLYVVNLKTEATLELFDVLGRKAGAYEVSENKREANIAQFANGIYVYRITDKKENTVSTGKLIIKR
jgi:hypothetical protein